MIEKRSLEELLRHTDCLACLADEPDALVAAASEESFAEGDLLVEQGAPAEAAWLIAEGRLELLRNEADEQRRIGQVGAGDVLGELEVLDRCDHPATAKALSDGTAWRLPGEAIDRLLSRQPDLARKVVLHLGRRLRRKTRPYSDLAAENAEKRLKVAVFDTKPYTEETFRRVNAGRWRLKFFQPRLTPDTASLADGFDVVCAFVNDDLGAEVLDRLADCGVGLVALRAAGYNNVDLQAAEKNAISVARVPAYSPHAVAEHATALMLTLNRQTHRAHNRVREGNFSLNGLVGFDMHGKTAGVLGTGKIGVCTAGILLGFGCRVLGYDKYPDDDLARREGFEYVELDELLGESDILSLHVPLLESTYHIIDAEAIAKMKTGVMLINTSRGALLDTAALIDGLKNRKIGAAGLDVYEEESEYFFEDRSEEVITDDLLARLLTFPNVLVTSHQGFLTTEALDNIAETTFQNIAEHQEGKRGEELTHGVCPRCG